MLHNNINFITKKNYQNKSGYFTFISSFKPDNVMGSLRHRSSIDCINWLLSSGTILGTVVINGNKEGILPLKPNDVAFIGLSDFSFDNIGSFMLDLFLISTVADCKNFLHLK